MRKKKLVDEVLDDSSFDFKETVLDDNTTDDNTVVDGLTDNEDDEFKELLLNIKNKNTEWF